MIFVEAESGDFLKEAQPITYVKPCYDGNTWHLSDGHESPSVRLISDPDIDTKVTLVLPPDWNASILQQSGDPINLRELTKGVHDVNQISDETRTKMHLVFPENPWFYPTSDGSLSLDISVLDIGVRLTIENGGKSQNFIIRRSSVSVV